MSNQIQGWQTPDKLVIVRFQEPNPIAPEPFNVKIKDYPAIYGNQYVSYKMRTSLSYDGIGNWLGVEGDISRHVDYDLATGLDIAVDAKITNIIWIEPEEDPLSATINFEIIGVDSNGLETVLNPEGTQIPVELNIINEDRAFASTDFEGFNWLLNNPAPETQAIQIYATAPFFIMVPKVYDLLPNPNFTEVNQTAGAYRFYKCEVEANPIEISVKPNATIVEEYQLNNPNNDLLTHQFWLFNSPISGFNFHLDLSCRFWENEFLGFDKGNLEFFAIKNIQEATSTFLKVLAFTNWTLTYPDWLTIYPDAGDGFKMLVVQPILSHNLEEGVYQGEIIVNNGQEEVALPVKHTVVGRLYLGYEENAVNFTLENTQETTVYDTNAQDNYLATKLDIVQMVYGQNFYETNSFDFVNGFFKNKTNLHLGEIIERGTSKMSLEDFKQILQYTGILASNFAPLKFVEYYRPIRVKANFDVKSKATEDVIFHRYIHNLQFVRGRKPEALKEDSGFLSYKNTPVRITENSLVLLNFLSAYSIAHFTVKKNRELIHQETFSTPQNKVRGAVLRNTFAAGDHIEVEFKKSAASPSTAAGIGFQADLVRHKQEYLVFPKGKYSTHIFYTTEYGTVECFEFTGEFSYQSEYDFVEIESLENMVKTLRNLKTSKTQKFTINSGFIPKSNSIIIDAIIHAEKAWLMLDKRNFVELKAETKKMSNSGSDVATYSYDVEFKINPEHARKVYM